MKPRIRSAITAATAVAAVLALAVTSWAVSSNSDPGTKARGAASVDRATAPEHGTLASVATASVEPATTSTDRAVRARRKPHKLYWGAHIGTQFTGTEAPWDMSALATFERKARKNVSILAFGAPFADCSGPSCVFNEFPTTPLEDIRRHGAIPFFSWSSAATPTDTTQPNFQLADVANGHFDSYITRFAEAARAWGHPFFLRFNWEMNGNWYQWSELRNGNRHGDYVAAWRHVHNIFTSVGASNATWVWCPNVEIKARRGRATVSEIARFQRLRALYPGKAYVDWTCLDGFNWGSNPANPNPWRSFSEIFRSTYRKVTRKIARGKPMIIGETASSDFGGSKKAWIRNALATLPRNYGKIRGLVWFNVLDRNIDWPIESSRSSLRAFRRGINKRAYLGNKFGDLNGSPIPRPR
jgi:hypothetical protein